MLELINITKKFSQEAAFVCTAVDNVSVTFAPQSFTVITGSGRSGKTTLRNLISGRLLADSGSVFFNGMDLTSKPEYRRAAYIGQMYSDPTMGTIAELTVKENLLLSMRRGLFSQFKLRLSRSESHDIISMLEYADAGLLPLMNRPAGELSGGQRQILTLLMATCRRQRLLLLDDPTSMLSAPDSEIVTRMIANVIEKKQLTAILITRSLQLAIRLGQRLLLMHNGRVILDAGGMQKKKLHSDDLYSRLQEELRLESIDVNTTSMLEKTYI